MDDFLGACSDLFTQVGDPVADRQDDPNQSLNLCEFEGLFAHRRGARLEQLFDDLDPLPGQVQAG